MSGGVDTLVYMANQIARYFQSQPGEAAAEATCDHLKSFWEPRMRKAIVAHLESGGDGLAPIAADAVRLLPEAAPTHGGV